MNFIKEYCADVKTAVIRLNHYGSSLDVFDEMCQQARIDLPGIQNKDIRVVQYGGDRYKRTFGIEFKSNENPGNYKDISILEYRL